MGLDEGLVEVGEVLGRCAMGERDGVREGWLEEGECVGETEGLSVVGERLGTCEGLLDDGDRVGERVGKAVEGLLEGCSVMGDVEGV